MCIIFEKAYSWPNPQPVTLSTGYQAFYKSSLVHLFKPGSALSRYLIWLDGDRYRSLNLSALQGVKQPALPAYLSQVTLNLILSWEGLF